MTQVCHTPSKGIMLRLLSGLFLLVYFYFALSDTLDPSLTHTPLAHALDPSLTHMPFALLFFVHGPYLLV